MGYPILKNRFSGPWPAFILITITVIIIYSNIYRSPLVFDSRSRIEDNQEIRDLTNYFSLEQLLQPRAVVDFTFALNYKFGKLNVFGYHLVNVFIHILNGILVYFLVLTIFELLFSMSQFSKPPPSINASTSFMALLAALIFVTHPIQTQAVTYVVQRYTSMAAMFYMASVLCYLRARMIQGATRQYTHLPEGKRRKSNKKEIKTKRKGKSPNKKGKMSKREDEKKTKSEVFLLYALSIIFGMFAFLSKQNTASLPGAIILAEVLLVDRTWQGWKKKIPWFVLFSLSWILFVALVSMHYGGAAQGGELLEDVSGLMKDTETVSRWEYLCTQFNVLVVYIRLLFLPLQQNLDYAFLFRRGFFDGYTPLAFLFLTGIALLGITQIKKRPVISLGIFWFFITLSVESSIIPIRDAMFEHRLYLPAFGFTLIVSILLFYLFSKGRSWPLFFSIFIIISLGTTTFQRNKIWQDSITLWSDVISKNPQNPRGHTSLGHALLARGQIEKAVAHYLEALRIKPDYVGAHNNLGYALEIQGQMEKAIEHYSEALRIKPDYVKAHNNMGNALQKMEQFEKAIEHYSEVLRIMPDNAKAYSNMGSALNEMGRFEKAIEHYLEALRIDPSYVNAHINLGNTLQKQGLTEKAIARYFEALQINPNNERTHFILGNTLQKLGRTEKAIEHYLEALRIKPNYVEAHNNLGISLFRNGNVKGAIDHFRIALRIKPEHAGAKSNLYKALRFQQRSQ